MIIINTETNSFIESFGHFPDINYAATVCYQDLSRKLGFHTNEKAQSLLSQLVGTNAYIVGQTDKYPQALTNRITTNIKARLNDPCLVFTDVTLAFMEQVDNSKQYELDCLKLKLKKQTPNEAGLTLPLFKQIFKPHSDKKVNFDTLKIILAMCGSIQVWRYGELGLYCHYIGDINQLLDMFDEPISVRHSVYDYPSY